MKKFIIFIFVLTITIINVAFMAYLIRTNNLYKRQVDLIFSNEKVIKISDEPLIYICKSNDAIDCFEKFMLSDGWDLEDRMGSLSCFEKDGKIMAFDLSYRGSIAIWSYSSLKNE